MSPLKGGALKPRPHAGMLFTCYGVFYRYCNAFKLHAMFCNRKFNILNMLLPILKYLSCLISDILTDFSIVMGL